MRPNALRYFCLLIAVVISIDGRAQLRSVTAVGVLAGENICRLPTFRLANYDLVHSPAANQASIGITGFRSFGSWIGSATFNYFPGTWIRMDSLALDGSGHSVTIDCGYVISKSETMRIFPMAGLGRWTYRERLRKQEVPADVVGTHRFNSMIIDLSMNIYFIFYPYGNRHDHHMATLVGFKLGLNAGVPIRGMNSEQFDKWNSGIQSVYIQFMIAGISRRDRKGV